MKYLIKPTKNGWYLAAKNFWEHWSLRGGWFTPLDVLWDLEGYEFFNPCYVSIAILGFGVEVGKFEKRGEKRGD